MKTAIVTLSGMSPYSQSRPHAEPKKEREAADDYEKRTWKNRLHVDSDGQIFIPPMTLKNCLSDASAYLSMQIVGKGKATYRKHFDAGVMVMDAAPLFDANGEKIMAENVEGEWLFLPSNGIRGAGTRVWKCYPKIDDWHASGTFYVLDDTVTESVFERHIQEAGNFIGIGRFRPRNNGFYGRFKVENLEWQYEEAAQAAE